ncbi:SH3 domain-containing protein [Armillaria novae-zelandiae]|uniref:SH3 domain-containing protein n=1 Tax=Armillaria novae-zelandiae TaxID=153914 RepID=A0AA39UAH2_9AGAR|nr:SH3 domain-containing protein [Armillaria novae-zelandiae]
MTISNHSSATSLSRYAMARSPGDDIYNGSASRDFCNSFWGPDEAGVNILCARMRGAERTTDELKNFWKERSALEEEYGNRLMELSKRVIGRDEIGDLRIVLDTLKLETEKQAAAHIELATKIQSDLGKPTTHLLSQQSDLRRNSQIPMEKRFKLKLKQESYVATAREKYQSDCVRIDSYAKQIDVNSGKDVERLQAKLNRAKQTVQANEKDYATFTEKLKDISAAWVLEWRQFCDESQTMEEQRMEFMKDTLWAYANLVSTVCVSDDVSCEAIRTLLDQFEGDRDIENFVNDYGTGNKIHDPPSFVPFSHGESPPVAGPSAFTRLANFDRRKRGAPTRRTSMRKHSAESSPPPHTNPPPSKQTSSSPPKSTTAKQPRPTLPHPEHKSNGKIIPGSVPPSPPPNEGIGILFYVKALYDYKATIEEEFDFQVGDVIAVTATPDDGWWSGELLDEARREEGRHVFPSNFVCLF